MARGRDGARGVGGIKLNHGFCSVMESPLKTCLEVFIVHAWASKPVHFKLMELIEIQPLLHLRLEAVHRLQLV
jgi:hypothetical protein